jgi:23S rRNA pseudouridine2605 synthase
MQERVQKILAHAGLGSRRTCEDFIRQGRVTVNGRVAQLGQKADPARDRIALDGEPVRLPRDFTYVALYKPPGILSDRGRPSGDARTVYDLVSLPVRLFTVGRLDMDSEGLVLLTDDGELKEKLTHPRYEHEKEYHVLVQGRPKQDLFEKWRQGVFLDGRTTAPAEISFLRTEGPDVWLRVVLQEGRKRQIRRVAAMLGHPVLRLIRVRIASLELGDLRPSQWRRLRPQEVAQLKETKSSSPPRGRKRGPKSKRRRRRKKR